MELEAQPVIDGLRLTCTCSGFPEQYDVFDDLGKRLAYLRLRGGHFRVDVPDACGATIYEARPRGNGFFHDDERLHYLRQAVAAIKAHYET